MHDSSSLFVVVLITTTSKVKHLSTTTTSINMESPISYDELEEVELKSAFASLFHCIGEVNDEERLRLEVTANPTLSRITYNGKSILFEILERRRRMEEERLSIIKFMIQMNPSALIWKRSAQWYPRVGFTFGGMPPIFMIVHNGLHCILMPWIAANYSWVLDHKDGKRSVFDLIDHYNRRYDTSQCTTALIKQFFEAYLQALATQEDNNENSPLHSILSSRYCDVDLAKWMAQQCPNNMLKTNSDGQNPLHIACSSLSKYKEDNTSKICKYLITNFPESVRIFDRNSRLPIHLLLDKVIDKCQYKCVREVARCLLREYPKYYAIPTEFSFVPSSLPFIQHIKPLLDKEKELVENANQLRQMSVGLEEMPGTLSTAVGCTSDQLVRSTADVLNSWAISFIRVLDDKVKDISTQLDHACIHFDDNDTVCYS